MPAEIQFRFAGEVEAAGGRGASPFEGRSTLGVLESSAGGSSPATPHWYFAWECGWGLGWSGRFIGKAVSRGACPAQSMEGNALEYSSGFAPIQRCARWIAVQRSPARSTE